MLRVCHILSGDLWAGAEVMAYHLLKQLRESKDVDLFVILLNHGKLAGEVEKLGVPLAVLDEKQLSSPRMFQQIRRFLDRHAPHVVHSHRYKENFIAYLCSRAHKGTRLVSTQHGMPELIGRNASLKYRLIARVNFFLLAHSFHKIVAVSDDIKRTLTNEWGFSDAQVETIPNGIPIEAPRHGPDGEGFVIGSCGRLVPVKDFPFMVEIAREVARSTDNVRFELAGDGPERESIRHLIEKYGLEKHFLLRDYVEDVASFYSGLDLYLNTSLHEGIPMSVLEAMGHSIPVIASDVGGMDEILENGVEGYLIKGREPKAFADRCLELFRNERLRTEMAEATRVKVTQKFSVDRMAERYHRLYLDQAARCQ